MKINSKKIITLTIFLLILILSITWIAYFYLVRNSSPEKQPEKSNQEYCLADDEVVSYEIEEKKRCTGDGEASIKIFIESKNTRLKKYNFQIDNIRKNYHPIEVHKCGLYMVRMFNYNPNKTKQNPGYREELWRYNYNSGGKMIILLAEKPKEFISYYSTDFRVDPTETYVILVKGYLGEDDYALIIKDLETKEDVFVFPFQEIIDKHPDLAGNIMFNDWSNDGRYFWFKTHIGANVLGFFRIDTTTWKVDIFEAPENVMGGDVLNFNTGYVTVHPYNEWYGIYEIEQIEKEKMRKEGIGSEIYIESLINQERYFIDKTDEPLWFFKPKWISETELEYYLPSGEKKVHEIIE